MPTVMALKEFERLYNDALFLNRHRHSREAAAILNALERTGHHRAAVMGLLGTILFYDLNEIEEALPRLRESIALSPKSEISSLAMFHALMRRGERTLALSEARRFLRLKSSEEYSRLLKELDERVADDPTSDHTTAAGVASGGDPRQAARLSCFLLIDTSASIEPLLDGLFGGLQRLRTWLETHGPVRQCLDLVLVTFGGHVGHATDFCPVIGFDPPCASVATPRALGAALQFAAEALDSQLNAYRAKGVRHHCPWLVLLTCGSSDGEPPELTARAAEQIEALRAHHGAHVYPVVVTGGVKSADIESAVGVPPWQLRDDDLAALFDWLADGFAWVIGAPVTAVVSPSPAT